MGDIREESPELRYLLGASLAGAMPEHALVNALTEEALRTLIDALHAAFGPVANLPKGNAGVARLGQNLWQLVSPRADRRLRELCAKPEPISYEAAITGTRQSMRRAGLFAAGNLSTALSLLAFEAPLPPGSLVEPEGELGPAAARRTRPSPIWSASPSAASSPRRAGPLPPRRSGGAPRWAPARAPGPRRPSAAHGTDPSGSGRIGCPSLPRKSP